MEIKLPKDFSEFLECLNSHDVEYLLIGGYAVAVHGYPRATNDLDVFVSALPENANRLVSALRQFGFSDSNLSSEIFVRPQCLVVFGVEPLAIDILNYARGLDFEDAFRNRQKVFISHVAVNVVSYRDLLLNKRTVGRHKDLDDVEQLQRLHA